MLIEHPHAIVGRVARQQRLQAKREARAIGVIRYWTECGVSVSTPKLAQVMALPDRTVRRMVARLRDRGVIERVEDGYRIKREAA